MAAKYSHSSRLIDTELPPVPRRGVMCGLGALQGRVCPSGPPPIFPAVRVCDACPSLSVCNRNIQIGDRLLYAPRLPTRNDLM